MLDHQQIQEPSALLSTNWDARFLFVVLDPVINPPVEDLFVLTVFSIERFVEADVCCQPGGECQYYINLRGG
jgi:hypothetical protein